MKILLTLSPQDYDAVLFDVAAGYLNTVDRKPRYHDVGSFLKSCGIELIWP